MSALGLLNFVVLQWFGVRLARCRATLDQRKPFQHWVGEPVIFAPSRGSFVRSRIVSATFDTFTVQWYGLLRWVWPLTGWWSDYRWIARRR